jgi:hypothetical protein
VKGETAMATMDQLNRLLGKALFDDEFRALLLADPTAAAKKLKISLDSRQAARIQAIEKETADKLAAEFQHAVGLDRPAQGITLW